MEKNMKRNESIEIKRILDILRSKKIIIALILIMFTILGSIYSYHYVVPKYRSTSTLLLIPNTISEDKTVTNLELVINSELINTYSNIATNPKVLRQTIANLGLDMSEKQLLNSMQVNILDNTYIIEIAVSSTDPKQAMEITKELSNVFLNEIKEIYSLNNIGIVDEAELPQQPYNVKHIKDIAMFLAMGIMVCVALIMVIYIFDNTLKQEEDIENYMDVKNLGSIPIHDNKKQEVIHNDYAKSYITECINTIRTNILYMNAAKKARTILITSCTPQEGKSWVSANIATSFAKIDKRVLLIDADMRKGRADKIFKVSNQKGLSNYLHAMTGDIKKDIILGKNYIKETQIPNLHILTNGTVPPNPSELLGSNHMKELILLLKNVYDIIIVDAPPCKLVTDSMVLSTIIDSTVLVANANKTNINDLNEVKKSIEGVGGEVIGAILNKKKAKKETYRESYHHNDSEKRKEEKEKQIVSVNKVIKRAIIQLEKTGFNIEPEKNELIEKSVEENMPLSEKDRNDEDMKKFIKKQNRYLAQMVNTVSNMKVQLNSDRLQSKIENRNSKNKIEKLIRIKLEELQQEKLTKEEMRAIIKKEISSLEDLEQEKLTKEEMRAIIKKEISGLEDLEQEKLTKEEMQEIVRKEILSLETKEEEKLTKAQVRKIIRRELLNLKEIEQQRLETIKNKEDNEQQITEQIAQINDMLINLKDSYLELSNKLQTNHVPIQEINDIDNENVIDFKVLKKTKNKKKKAYSIDEDILYEELKNTATYVVTLDEKKDSDSSEEDYQNTMP